MENHDPPIQPKPSFSNSLFTSILIILALILLSVFPSQPPEFLNQTLVSNLWGLFQLLFIGIVAAYGLFGRRNGGNEVKVDAGERYFSGYEQISSVFDNEVRDFNLYDEKFLVDSWKWSPVLDKWEKSKLGKHSRSKGKLVDGEKCGLDRPLNLPVRSLSSKIAGNSYDESNNLIAERFSMKNMNEKQNYQSQYLCNESSDIVSLEKCDLDNWVKPKVIDDYKPLNLPIRRIVKDSNDECVDEMEADSGSERLSEKNGKNRKGAIRGLVPINLEKKFEEAVASPSPVPWNLRSSRVRVREKVMPPLDTRLSSMGAYEDEKMRLKGKKSGKNRIGKDVGFSSLGDMEFEKLNSEPIPNLVEVRGNGEVKHRLGKGESPTHSSFLMGNEFDKKVEKLSQANVKDEKENAKSPPCVRPSGEFGNNEKKLESRMEMRGKECDVKTLSESESFWASIYSPVKSISPSPNKLSPLSAVSTNEQIPKFEDLKKKDHQFSIGLEKISDIPLGTSNKSTKEEPREKMKLAALDTSLTRGKSVRTIRANKSYSVAESKEENYLNPMDEKAEKKGPKLEDVSLEKSSSFSEYQNEEKQKFGFSNEAQAGKEPVTPDGKAKPASVDNEELDTDEVDKKADAFIAKFREQIRLQKIDSIKRKRG